VLSVGAGVIVTAAMAYYDDDLVLLERCIRSLEHLCDRLVVCDGRYERYEPGGPVASPVDHRWHIEAVCADIGMPLVYDVPDRPYAGQLEKRTRLMQLAAEGSDWIVVVDADHVVHCAAAAVRHEFATTDADSLRFDFYTTPNYERPLSESAPTLWHAGLSNDKVNVALIIRAVPEIRVERFHWWYSGMVNGERRWLAAEGDGVYGHGKSVDIQAPYFVEHLCLYRSDRLVQLNRAFCEDRERILSQTGQEDAMQVAA
jgi:hypothetical protein